jgi:hypothetical protein
MCISCELEVKVVQYHWLSIQTWSMAILSNILASSNQIIKASTTTAAMSDNYLIIYLLHTYCNITDESAPG